MSQVDYNSFRRYYTIRERRSSGQAHLYFATDNLTGEQVVLKKLLAYKDRRYSLEHGIQRKICQIRAFYYNNIFTPHIYKGLAAILWCRAEEICLTNFFVSRQRALNEYFHYKEYVLAMSPLDSSHQLDQVLQQTLHNLLSTNNTMPFASLLRLLAQRIAQVHTQQLLPLQKAYRWGSIYALKRKFLHNIDLLNEVKDDGRSIDRDTQQLAVTLFHNMHHIHQRIEKSTYTYYFQQRIEQGWLRHCHGDLKSGNIWVLPYEHIEDQERAVQQVKILDAIDFKKIYYNIDILSDFAMLAVDILAYVREQCEGDILAELVEQCVIENFIEEYLIYTGQSSDEIARAVLQYYLLEKAIVCASVDLLPGGTLKRSKIFLHLAKHLCDTLKYL